MSVKRCAALILAVSSMTVTGQEPSTADRLYRAIRNDDLAALRTLARTSANVADGQGQTPLMWAAAFGSGRAVRLLLDAGADVKASTPSGMTPLHWAATDAMKTRALLDAGAEVDAVSQFGRTPLIAAASANGSGETVKLLLAHGARVNATDSTGMTALTAAAIVDNVASVNLLLARGADVNIKASTGFQATPLMAAAANGNVPLVKTLLARGADVTAISAERAATVKNGAVQFGYVSALHFAVMSGNLEAVKVLLRARAPVNAQDVRGMTPLMYALGTDRSQPEIVTTLLDAGADRTIKSKADEDAAAWAYKFQAAPVMAAMKLVSARTSTPGPVPLVSTHAAATARAAVERALPLLRTGADRTLSDGGCIACHAQPLTGLAVGAAVSRGWTVPASDDVSQSQAALAGAVPGLIQLREGGGSPDTQLFQTLLLALTNTPPSRATDAAAYYLAAKQRPDGSWRGVGATRAPMQDGDITRTAMAIATLRSYALPARAPEFQNRVARATKWLAGRSPVSTEERVMQLLGLHWSGAARSDTRLRELRLLQREDGGWGQTRDLASDAYATGQVLYTLRQLDVPATDPAIRRAVTFLLRTQREDGTWHVRNRAMKIQPYFESGFPYGHDQWISQAGSAWAALALAESAFEAQAITRAAR